MQKMYAYYNKTGQIHEVAGIDFQSKSYVLHQDPEKLVAKHGDVKVLEVIYDFENGGVVLEGDVFVNGAGDLFKVEKVGNKEFRFVSMGENLDEVHAGASAVIDDNFIDYFSGLEIVNNYYVLKNDLKNAKPKEPDFNVKILRLEGKEKTYYFYACNNKERKEIDLIKVIFIGHQLLEEKYARYTFPYNEYMELKELQEISPTELGHVFMNKAIDAMSDNDNDNNNDIDSDSDNNNNTDAEEENSVIYDWDYDWDSDSDSDISSVTVSSDKIVVSSNKINIENNTEENNCCGNPENCNLSCGIASMDSDSNDGDSDSNNEVSPCKYCNDTTGNCNCSLWN